MTTANRSAVYFTSEPEDFVDRVRPADVLLFDSMRPVSHMIKLAENSPVNHAAVYAGEGDIFHATVPHQPGEGAVTRVPLLKRLMSGTHRTVTALSHDGTARGEVDPEPVIEQAERMSDERGRYARVDLISLIIPTFWRTYHAYFNSDSTTNETIRELLEYLTTNVLADIEGAADLNESAAQPGPETLTVTCSEMVFLCYDRTRKGSLQIADPLSRWARDLARDYRVSTAVQGVMGSLGSALAFYPPAPRQRRPSDSGRIGGSVPAGADITDRKATVGLRFSGEEMAHLVERAKRVFTNQALHNLTLGKYGSETPDPGSPLADMVTPGDLWRSPSLHAHAVFHLPPSYLIPTSDAVGDED